MSFIEKSWIYLGLGCYFVFEKYFFATKALIHILNITDKKACKIQNIL